MYYFSKRINNIPIKISLKSNNLEYCRIQRDKILQRLSVSGNKKTIKAELNPNLEFDSETLEKIMELGIRALGKNSNYSNVLREQQLTQQTIYKISDKNDLEEISKKLDSINVPKEIITLPEAKKPPKIKKKITFFQLEELFLNQKIKVGKVGISSIKMYKASFEDLQNYFKDIDINLLKYKDLEEFQNFLISKKLANNTINNKITYLRMYLAFAEKLELIEKNYANGLEMLKEKKKKKENYEDSEVLTLIKNAPKEFQDFLKVAAYTGMRLQEILSIQEIHIDQKTKIKYIKVEDAKTTSGIRKVPLHCEIENIKFPLFVKPERYDTIRKFSTYMGKEINKYIHKTILKKSIHTFRGTFINRLVNSHPEFVHIIQEVVGHSKGDKSITLDTYSKEFDIKLKKEIIDGLKYD